MIYKRNIRILVIYDLIFLNLIPVSKSSKPLKGSTVRTGLPSFCQNEYHSTPTVHVIKLNPQFATLCHLRKANCAEADYTFI